VRIRRRWCSLTARTLSRSSRRRVPIMRSQIAFRSGCPGWAGEDPDAIGGEDRIECPGEARVSVSKQKRHGGGAVGEQVAGGLGGPRAGRVRGHAEQMGPAGAVLDRDQRIEPSEKYGVHVHKVHGQDGLGLRGEELAPGRARPTRCGIDTGVVQDLPYGGGGDAMGRAGPVRPARGGVPRLDSRLPSESRDPSPPLGSGDVRAGGVRCSPICPRPACDARPGSWRA
jgi:hypothetical protein